MSDAMQVISWIATAASLVGVVLNIRQDRRCFGIWMVTNAFWAGYDFSIGATAQAALFTVYFCLAVYGFREWRKTAA